VVEFFSHSFVNFFSNHYHHHHDNYYYPPPHFVFCPFLILFTSFSNIPFWVTHFSLSHIPYFSAHKMHCDFFVRNLKKKKKIMLNVF
jgi:hypothetical protein